MQQTRMLDVDAPARLGDGLHVLGTSVGWMPLHDSAWIAVTGEDRVRWLNGMVTNSVQALQPGEGAYSFLLNAQGRIQGDCTVWAEQERLLLQTDKAQAETLITLLDKFIIMDDVELTPLVRSGYALAGPAAAAVLEGLGLPVPSQDLRTAEGHLAAPADAQEHLSAADTAVTVLRAYSPVVPRYEVWCADARTGNDFEALLSSEAETSAASFELLRVLEERPVFGADLKDRDLPQETAQMRALHFNKGCYLGQEIVERIRSRGQVHRTFAAFRLLGTKPSNGTELKVDGKPVGALTTVASEVIDGDQLALGFVRREVLERGQPLLYDGGTAEARGRSVASNV